MRTRERDTTGLTTFSSGYSDAASGAGVANGIPFTFTRTGTGVYVFRFDSVLTPLVVLVTASALTGHSATAKDFGPGTFTIVTLVNNAAANSAGNWTCTARDGRR
jgi:hypothetical protein